MGRFRIGSKEINLILDRTIQEGELLFENEQNSEAPAKLFVDTDGKLKFRNRGEDPRFIGDGTGSGGGVDGRSVTQGDRDPNEYHDMPNSSGLSSEQIEYFNDVKAARVGDSYIDNENFILYIKKREFQQGLLKVWVQRGSAFRGEDGDPTINGILSNEIHTVSSTVDGALLEDLSTAGGRFSVYDGTAYANGVVFKASTDGNIFVGAGSMISSSGVRLVIDSSGYYTLSLATTGWIKSVNTVSFVLRAVVGALTIDKVYTITKSKGAGVVRLIADRQAFTRDGEGNFSPLQQTVTFNVQTGNIASDATIEWSLYKLAPDNTWIQILNANDYLNPVANTATLDEQGFGGALIALSVIGSAVKVRATIGTIYDEITLISIADGAQGEIGPQGADGESPYNGILTNESHTVPSNEDGTNTLGLGITPANKAGGFFRVYEGTAVLSSGVSFSAVGSGSSVSDGVSSVTQDGLRVEIDADSGEYSLFETSQNSWTSDSETFTLRASVGGVNLDKSYTITKSKGGKNAKLLYLSSDRQTFTTDADENLIPQSQTIRFYAKLQNITENNVTWTLYRLNSGEWQEVVNASSLLSATSTTGDSYVDLQIDQIKYASLFENTNTIKVEASADGFSDEISAVVVRDGARGLAYSALLTNESHTVPASADGVVSVSLASAGGYFLVYEGAELSTDVTFSVHDSPTGEGISAAINPTSGQYTISQTSWSVDSSTFTFRATIGTSGEHIDKTYTITKSKSGAQGEDAKLLYLTSTAQTFKKNGSNSYTPSTQVVEFNATLQNMQETSVTWELYRWITDAWVQVTDLSGKLSTGSTSASMNQDEYTSALGSGSYIKVKAIAEGLSDEISIVTVKDGADGEGSYNAFLTNEVHIVAATALGAVSNDDLQDSGAGGMFLVFEGTTEASADYAIKTGTSAGSYYEKQVDGLTMRIDKQTGEYEVYQDAGDQWSLSSKTVSYTLQATVGNSVIEKVFTITKSLAGLNGEPAKLVYLTSDSQTFKINGDGDPDPAEQIITFNASLQNTTDTSVVWTLSRWNINVWEPISIVGTTYITASSTSATMSYSQFIAALGSGSRVRLRATIENTLYDEISISKLQDGAAGKNAVSGLLTNESHTVSADSDGTNVQGLGSAGGQFVVFIGDEAATTGVTYKVSDDGEFVGATNIATESGLTLTIQSNGQYSLTEGSGGWISDTAVFHIQASVSGYPNITKVYTITKSKGGANAKLLYLTIDRLAFAKDSTGNYSPSSQIATLNVSKKNITSPTTFWDIFKQQGTNWVGVTGSLSSYLTVSGDSATMSQSQFDLARGGTPSVKVSAESDGVSDEVSLIFVSDGAAGRDGTNGADGIDGIDGVNGAPGADGVNAKAVKLLADSYQVSYNSNGKSPSAQSITLTATGSNLISTAEFHFFKGTTGVQSGSLNTLQVQISDFDVTFAGGAPVTYKVKAVENSVAVADDIITIVGTKEGSSAITPVLTNSTHAFVADATGAITSDYDDGATGISVYQGNTLLNATAATELSDGEFKVTTSTSGISISAGSVQPSGKEIIFTPSSMTADSARVTYTIYVKDSAGAESTLIQIQTFSKSKAGVDGADGTDGVDGIDGANGTPGADGLNAKSIKLIASSYQVAYNAAGGSPSSSSITLSTTGSNLVSGTQYEFLLGSSVVQAKSVTDTHVVSIGDFSQTFTDGTPLTYRVKAYEGSVAVADDVITIVGTKEGASAITPVLTNSTHAFVADSSGAITSDYTDGATGIKVFEGNNALTPVSTSTLNNGQFKVSTSPSSISVGSGVIDSTNKEITFTPSSMTADSARVTYTITAKDSTGTETVLTQVQTFSKSKAGATGASGSSAMVVKLESTKYQLPYASSGSPVASGTFTLSASAQNHTPSSYEFSTSTNGGSSYSTITSSGASATIDIPSAYFSSPIIYRVVTKDVDDAVVAQDSITVIATQDGATSLLPVLTNSTHAFPADANGTVSSINYSLGATEIYVYEGNSLLTPVSSATSLAGQSSKFKVIPTASGISVGASIDATNKKVTYTPTNASMSDDSANINYTIEAVDSKGNSYSYTQVQTFSKSKQGAIGATGSTGATGAAGLNAKVVKLTSTAYQVSYNSAGSGSNPQSITLTASGTHHVGSVYYEFISGSTTLQNTTVGTLERTFTDFNSMFGSGGAPITYAVRTRESASSGTVVSQDSITVIGTKEGASTINPILSNETHAYVADASGNISSLSGGETDISVYEGNTLLTPVTSLTGNSQFTVSATPSSGYAGSIGSPDTVNNKLVYTPSSFSNANDTATVTFTITARDKNGKDTIFTKTQTLAKSKQGVQGATGATGVTGAPGASGADGRGQFQGTGDPNEIDGYATAALWAVYSNSRFSVSTAEGEVDWNEIRSARIGDRYLDIRTGLTYTKDANNWETRTTSLLSNVEKKGQAEFSLKKSWVTDDDSKQTFDGSMISFNDFVSINESNLNNSVSSMFEWFASDVRSVNSLNIMNPNADTSELVVGNRHEGTTFLFSTGSDTYTSVYSNKLTSVSAPSMLSYSGSNSAIYHFDTTHVDTIRMKVRRPSTALPGVMTHNGSLRKNTANPEYSYYFDGVSGINIPYSLSTDITGQTTNSFSIESWVYIIAPNDEDVDGWNRFCIAGQESSWHFYLEAGSDKFIQNLWFLARDQTSTLAVRGAYVGGRIEYGKWNHVVVSRESGNFFFYINGVKEAGTTTSLNGVSILSSVAKPLMIGYNINSSYHWKMHGYMYNTRIVNNGNAYTTNFTPQSQGGSLPAPASGTVALLTCRTNQLADLSSNSHRLSFFKPSPPSYIKRYYRIAGTGDLYDFVTRDNANSLVPGTAAGSITVDDPYSDDAFGYMNLTVDDSSSYADSYYIPDSQGLRLSSNSSGTNYNLSISFWMKITATPSTTQYVISKSSSTTTYEYYAYLSTGRQMGFRIKTTGGPGSTIYIQAQTSNSFNLNQWYHVTISYAGGDGSTFDPSNINFYVGGVLWSAVGTASGTSAGYSTSANIPVTIGSISHSSTLGSSGDFTGKIGGLMFSDTAVNSTQAAEIYSYVTSSPSKPLVGSNDAGWIGKLEFCDYQDVGFPYSRSATISKDPTYDLDGEWTIIEWDMSQVPSWRRGASLSLLKNRITGVRITMFETKNERIDIQWIAYGKKTQNPITSWNDIKKNDTTSTNRFPIDVGDIGGLSASSTYKGGLLYNYTLAGGTPNCAEALFGEFEYYPKLPGVTVSDTGIIKAATSVRITGSINQNYLAFPVNADGGGGTPTSDAYWYLNSSTYDSSIGGSQTASGDGALSIHRKGLNFNTTATMYRQLFSFVDANGVRGLKFHKLTTSNDWTIGANGVGQFLVALNGSSKVWIDSSTFTIDSSHSIVAPWIQNNPGSGAAVLVDSTGILRRTSSSRKYKKDIEDLDYSIVSTSISNLRPVWYRSINPAGDDKKEWSHIGLIAEEVHEIEPRLVVYKTLETVENEDGSKSTAEIGEPIPEDVDYARLSVILLAEIQEQKRKIDSQQEIISQLIQRIEALENK